MLTEGQKRYRKYKETYKKYRDSHEREPYNPVKVKKWNKKGRDISRYGGNRMEVLVRDDFSCTVCGMTNEEHLSLFNRELTIHHIDGTGCNTRKSKKNNTMDNLTTLCLRCHGKIDHRRKND